MGPFDAEAMAVASIIASHVGLSVEIASAFFGQQALAAQMREANASRAVIEQAKCILMGARRCSPDEAFDVLVKLAQGSNRKLRDFAKAVVDEATVGPFNSVMPATWPCVRP